jgi:hypothetical protein
MEVLAFVAPSSWGEAVTVFVGKQSCDGATVGRILELVVREPWSFGSV